MQVGTQLFLQGVALRHVLHTLIRVNQAEVEERIKDIHVIILHHILLLLLQLRILHVHVVGREGEVMFLFRQMQKVFVEVLLILCSELVVKLGFELQAMFEVKGGLGVLSQ